MSDELSSTRVTDDFRMLDQVFDEMQVKRRSVGDKLKTIIEGMVINPTEARVTEVQMQVVGGYLAILKQQEDNIVKRINTKLKKEEADTDSKHSAAVADLLARVNLNNLRVGTGAGTHDAMLSEHNIEQVFTDSGLEPVSAGELKTDPNDVVR
jgi:hypothetical protein